MLIISILLPHFIKTGQMYDKLGTLQKKKDIHLYLFN